MHSSEYIKPEAENLAVSSIPVICTSPGIDPGGSVEDFDWGNDTGIEPGGSGNDFDWGN